MTEQAQNILQSNNAASIGEAFRILGLNAPPGLQLPGSASLNVPPGAQGSPWGRMDLGSPQMVSMSPGIGDPAQAALALEALVRSQQAQLNTLYERLGMSPGGGAGPGVNDGTAPMGNVMGMPVVRGVVPGQVLGPEGPVAAAARLCGHKTSKNHM